MPWVKADTSQDKFEVKKADDGRLYFEVDDPNDTYRGKNQAATGEEACEEWPQVKPEDAPEPLLDLEQAWVDVMSDTPLPSKQELTEDITAQNAAILVKELRYHILASTKAPEAEKEGGEDNGEGDTKPAAASSEELGGNTQNLRDCEQEEPLKSVYGASILLKLQCEDKSVQKVVPKRSYAELALFISDITLNLESAFEEDERIAQILLDTFAFEMCCLMLARYLDGIETCTAILEDCCYALLKLCAERANAKEMHIAFKGFISKIDTVYIEATAYLILQPLMNLWGAVIVRMPRKRRPFVQEMVRTYDKLYPTANSFQTCFVPENGVGTEAPGRISRLQDTLLQFAQRLTQVQLEQREREVAIRLKVDMLGRQNLEPSLAAAVGEHSAPNSESTKGAESDIEKKEAEKREQQAEKDAFDVAKDWVSERAVTLSHVLQLQSIFWQRLPLPAGEDRNVPKGKKPKANKKSTLASSGHIVSDEEKEEALCISMRLFKNLGWTNPVLVCQLAWNGLNLTPVTRAQELMRAHIGTDIRSKKEKKSTLYSLTSIGHYLCASVRAGTQHRLNGIEGACEDDYAVELSGTAFDYLDPEYAFDLTLPFLVSIIPQVAVPTCVAGVRTIRAFLERIPDDRFSSLADLLRLRCGTAAMAREVSVIGLAHHLTKAVSMLDDPRHRRMAYETLQLLVRKCAGAAARYTLVECAFLEASRGAVCAQLVTEMKDALRFSDAVAGEGMWTARKGDGLRERFVLLVLPRYLMPKKDLLRVVDGIASTVNALVYVAVRDRAVVEGGGGGDAGRVEEVKRVMGFSKEYGRVGRLCISALGAVAHHDRMNLRGSQLAKRNVSDAQAFFFAAGRTVNSCVTAMLTLDLAMENLTL